MIDQRLTKKKPKTKIQKKNFILKKVMLCIMHIIFHYFLKTKC